MNYRDYVDNRPIKFVNGIAYRFVIYRHKESYVRLYETAAANTGTKVHISELNGGCSLWAETSQRDLSKFWREVERVIRLQEASQIYIQKVLSKLRAQGWTVTNFGRNFKG